MCLALGGKGQRQLQPLRHIARAGWCITQGKQPDCQRGDADSAYYKVWPTPTMFETWIAFVLGDIGIWVYEGAPAPESISGHGLEPVMQRQEEVIKKRLKTVLNKSKNEITENDLQALSTYDSRMTTKVLEALENASDRSWLEQNLSNRIALGQVVDRALMAKKILYAGGQDPHIQAITPARQSLDSAMARLKDEIDLLLYDSKVRNQLLGDYGSFILGRKQIADIRNEQRMPFETNRTQ